MTKNEYSDNQFFHELALRLENLVTQCLPFKTAVPESEVPTVAHASADPALKAAVN